MNLPQHLFDGDVSVQVILCQPDKTRIGEILPYNKNGTFKFNSYSEISFTIDRYYNDLSTGETKVNPYYDLIEPPRIIELRGIGHFVIQDGGEDINDSETKSVTAFSLEYSTGQKYLESFYVNTGEEGSVETMYHAKTHGAEYAIDVYYEKATSWDKFGRYYKKEYTNTNAYNYVEVQVLDESDFASYKGTNSEDTLYVKAYPNVRFYWPTKPELSLLHLVFAYIPEWEIGHVDKELWHEERTFSEDRTAVYDFLYNTAAETLKFVMVWDTVSNDGKNTVSFYKTEEDGITTELTPASTYLDGVLYFNQDGSVANPQPTNKDQILFGDYYIKYDAIETQWSTDVFISKDNLASEIQISYSADDIKTKLKITGADDLDIRDVNLGQNYVLNLDYYNTDLWMGKDLHSKYDKYKQYLSEKTDEYSKLISAWSATYNEYNDLMNNVPVEPSVLLIGDKFEKLYCTYGLRKTTTYNEDAIYYDVDGNEITPTLNDDGDLSEEYYINTVNMQLPILKEKLGLYRVGVDSTGKISQTDKTDDVLLTLTNDNSDSAVIRVRCLEKGKGYENYQYEIVRTLTNSTTGFIHTEKFTLQEWISGSLTADYVSSDNRRMELNGFTVKSIGTLGAYLCLSKDETIKEDMEDYGIKLLEEKQNVYTSIFITQTEGYMSQEGSQCVASKSEPTGSITEGSKWLKTDDDDATVYIYVGKNGTHYNGRWNIYSTGDNSADFENYTRFLDNYKKLQTVQAVLNDKQRVADYLLDGIKVNNTYINFDNNYDKSYYLTWLLRAAIAHYMVTNYVVSVSEPSEEYKKDGVMWFQHNEYTSNLAVYKYDGSSKKWIPQSSNDDGFGFNTILTNYFIDKDKTFAYLTYILDPTYERATEFADNYTYLIRINRDIDGVTFHSYNKFYAQPNNSSDVLNTYEGIISNDMIISEGTRCYFTIDDVQYVFDAPQNLNKDSVLICNPDTKKLIVGITTLELEEYDGEDTVADTNGLFFELKEFYIARGLEYAVYTTSGVPYVSYAASQGVCLARMNYIKQLTDMNAYFSNEELMRLSPFIREDEFNDSNFLLTGYESEEEQMKVKQSLLESGVDELAKLSRPKLSFDATMANLLAIPEFAPLRWQFKLGNFVNVEIRKDYIEKARLLEVNINFDDASDFSCTFGNLISTKSEIDKHADLLSQAVTVSKQVASHASNWQKGANKATALDQAINDGLKDAALSVGSANGQSIIWDQYGIRGRKLIDGTTNQYDDKQFALINNKLVFTDDNWQTSRAVVGEFTIDIDGQKQDMYGLLADAIVGGYIQGTEIVGGKLKIGGSGGTFLVNEDGSVEIKSSSGDDLYAQQSAITAIDSAYKYSVQIVHTGKAVFSSKTDTATLTARIYRRGVDATDEFRSAGVVVYWEKNPSESGWTATPITSEDSYSILLDSDDVQNSAQISCYIDPTEEQIQEIENKYND